MKYIGIDLGTTYSCIAVADSVGSPSVKKVLGKDTTPSVIYFKDANTRIIGKGAKDKRKLHPDHVIELVKRYMGESDFESKQPLFRQYGKLWTPEELSGEILKHMMEGYTKAYGDEEYVCTVTCPAGYNAGKRLLVKEAAKKAGIKGEVNVINEPTSAALDFCETEKFTGGILLFDLGGGTLDVTVLACIPQPNGSNRYVVVCSEGEEKCGGADWDKVINDEIHKVVSDYVGLSISEIREDKEFEAWCDVNSEEIKKELTESDHSSEIEFQGEEIPFEISRDRFEGLTRGLCDTAVSKMDFVLQNYAKFASDKGLRDFTIGMVVLVGGSSYMPQISKAIESRFPQFAGKVRSHEPDHSIARGAAYYSRMSVEIEDSVPEIPVPSGGSNNNSAEIIECTFNDVLSRTFGTDCRDVNTRKWMCDNLLFKNDTIPCKIVRDYSISKGQSIISNKVFMNNCRDKEKERLVEIDDCVLLGDFDMTLPKPAPRDGYIRVTFEVSADGIITAVGECNGYTTRVSIEHWDYQSKN